MATADEVTHIHALSVDVVDTTAAGDAFIGGLAAALTRGLPLVDAVRYANCAGALAVTRRGAQPSLPNATEVNAAFALRGLPASEASALGKERGEI
jgi:ribokinase